MRDVAFLVGSLAVIGLALGVAPQPVALRLGGGAVLLLLWGYGLWRAMTGRLGPASPVRLLPGHALLFLALSLVGAQAGLGVWFSIPPLTALLDSVRRRSLSLVVYAILWLVLFGLLHQVVALGRNLTGWAFALWTAGVACVAALFVANGMRRRWTKGVVL